MGVKEINGSASFDTAIRVPSLVVVDFFATWCGPCIQIAPFIEELSHKYPDVVFLKVNAEANRDIAEKCNIRSYPTFHFYVNGTKVDQLSGANSQKLENMVVSLKATATGVPTFGGKGQTLGAGTSVPWDGVGSPPGQENARAARLKAFGHLDAKQKESIYKDRDVPSVSSSSTNTSSNTTSTGTSTSFQEDEDEAIAKAIALSMAQETNVTLDEKVNSEKVDNKNVNTEGTSGGVDNNTEEDWDGEEMVPVPVDNTLLAQLVSMDFSDVRARKGLVHGHTLEGALAWIEENQGNPDIDQPYMVKKKDAIPKKPLTAEEKAAKLLELKEKAARIKRERAEKEKADELQREKERRTRGQNIAETDEERQRLARKREIARKKKEKEDSIKERQRLRAEIARDKELRKANKGVLPSVLGVDGYNPSAVQYDQKAEVTPSTSSPAPTSTSSATTTSSAPTPVPVPKTSQPATKRAAVDVPPADPIKVIDNAISTIARYRTGGDGGAALKLLILLLRNVVTHPGDPKYRSINMEGKAYKTKLGHLVGPSALLKAVGFRVNDTGDKLVLPDE